MNNLFALIITLSFLVFTFIFFYLLRAIFTLQRKERAAEVKDTSQVGFVLDAFNDLVSRLKEKERDLDDLRRKAEEKAFEIETYNENILQSVPSGVISFDRDLKVTKMNVAAERILGMRGDDVKGKKYSEIFDNPICEMIENKETVDRTEFGYTTQSRKRIWLGLNMSPLKDNMKNVIGRTLVFTDLTELKAFQSRKELRERLFTLGEMSAGIAHELRNPMAVISGYTKMLLKRVEGDAVPAVEAIAGEVTVMDRIISDFLSFARNSELVITEVDLNELLRNCVDAAREDMEGVNIVNNAGPFPLIRADEVQLRQSVSNLLRNAIESMPEGGEVKIEGKTEEALVLSITDKGHGIPENIKDKIFLPFYTTKERGTGLGLSIVHKIVSSHGGTIQVDSNDSGTTFTVKFPKEMIIH